MRMGADARRPGLVSAGRFLLAVLVTLALLALLIRRAGGGDDLRQALVHASPPAVLGALALGGVALLLATERWRTILRALRRPVAYSRAVYAVLATFPLAAVTPSRLADLLRAVVVRDSVPVVEGMGSVLTEKLFDVQSLLVLALAGALAQGSRGEASELVTAAAVAGLGLFWAGFAWLPRHLRRWLGALDRWPRLAPVGQILHGVEALRRDPRRLAVVLVLSIAGWLFSLMIIVALLRATGSSLPWPLVLLAWPAAIFAGALPITASGLGTRDGAFLLTISGLSPGPVEAAPILAATLLYPLVTSWFYALVGLPFLAHLVRSDPAARRAAFRRAAGRPRVD
jgi:uncharacterized membrane protein YbhN (UPF0104 family)